MLPANRSGTTWSQLNETTSKSVTYTYNALNRQDGSTTTANPLDQVVALVRNRANMARFVCMSENRVKDGVTSGGFESHNKNLLGHINKLCVDNLVAIRSIYNGSTK